MNGLGLFDKLKPMYGPDPKPQPFVMFSQTESGLWIATETPNSNP